MAGRQARRRGELQRQELAALRLAVELMALRVNLQTAPEHAAPDGYRLAAWIAEDLRRLAAASAAIRRSRTWLRMMTPTAISPSRVSRRLRRLARRVRRAG